MAVKVQPRARKDEIVGLHNDRLKIRIKAPPVEGRANAYLCGFLAGLCKLPKRRIEVLSGAQNTLKSIRIRDADMLTAAQLAPLGVQTP